MIELKDISNPEATFERSRQLNIELSDMAPADRRIVLLFALIHCTHDATVAQLEKELRPVTAELVRKTCTEALTKPDYIRSLLTASTHKIDLLGTLFCLAATIANLAQKDPS